MKNYIVQASNYSRKARLIIYSLGIVVLAFLVLMFYYNKKIHSETLSSGKRFYATIINVDCTRGKGKSSLFFKNEGNEVRHVNVRYTDCETFRRGDTISVFNIGITIGMNLSRAHHGQHSEMTDCCQHGLSKIAAKCYIHL